MPAVGEHLRRRRIREYVTIRKWIGAIGPEWPNPEVDPVLGVAPGVEYG